MKLKLHKDEWYPVFTLTDRIFITDETVEFTNDEIKQLRQLELVFNEWQRHLSEKFDLPESPKFSFIELFEGGGSEAS
jgi:hypothetical protein